jgi:hypothetical protein
LIAEIMEIVEKNNIIDEINCFVEQARARILRSQHGALPFGFRAAMLTAFDRWWPAEASWRRGALALTIVRDEGLPVWDRLDLQQPDREVPNLFLETCRTILSARTDHRYGEHLAAIADIYRILCEAYPGLDPLPLKQRHRAWGPSVAQVLRGLRRIVGLMPFEPNHFTNFQQSVQRILYRIDSIPADWFLIAPERGPALCVPMAALDACWFAISDSAYDWDVGPEESDNEVDPDLWDAHFLTSMAVAGGPAWEQYCDDDARRSYWLRWVEAWSKVSREDRGRGAGKQLDRGVLHIRGDGS